MADPQTFLMAYNALHKDKEASYPNRQARVEGKSQASEMNISDSLDAGIFQLLAQHGQQLLNSNDMQPRPTPGAKSPKPTPEPSPEQQKHQQWLKQRLTQEIKQRYQPLDKFTKRTLFELGRDNTLRKAAGQFQNQMQQMSPRQRLKFVLGLKIQLKFAARQLKDIGEKATATLDPANTFNLMLNPGGSILFKNAMANEMQDDINAANQTQQGNERSEENSAENMIAGEQKQAGNEKTQGLEEAAKMLGADKAATLASSESASNLAQDAANPLRLAQKRLEPEGKALKHEERKFGKKLVKEFEKHFGKEHMPRPSPAA